MVRRSNQHLHLLKAVLTFISNIKSEMMSIKPSEKIKSVLFIDLYYTETLTRQKRRWVPAVLWSTAHQGQGGLNQS